MPKDYMSEYKTQAIKHENNSLYWLSLKYHIPVERILYLCDMDSQERIAILDEPMQALIISKDPMDSDVYCPTCHNTVSGGWPEEHPEERFVYQCPHCGQALNPFKTVMQGMTPNTTASNTKTWATLHDFWSNNEGCIVDFFDKNGKSIDDLDYPIETKVDLVLDNLFNSENHYRITLDVEQKGADPT